MIRGAYDGATVFFFIELRWEEENVEDERNQILYKTFCQHA